MIPSPVQSFLTQNDYGTVTDASPVGGGCISNGQILTTQSGTTFFLKTNPNTPVDMFARETEGLVTLSVSDGPTVPQVYLHGRDFILLEDLSPAPREKDYWPSFGRKLAALHEHTNSRYGFEHHNYIGSTEHRA
jgi:fructosamine-3-kinase